MKNYTDVEPMVQISEVLIWQTSIVSGHAER